MSKPCANTNLDINFEANGKISVFHRGSGKTYVIGAGEYSVLRELDGTKDLGTIAACTQYSEAEVGYLVRQFEKIGFLHGQEPPKKLNLIRIKKPLVNGNRMIHPESFSEIRIQRQFTNIRCGCAPCGSSAASGLPDLTGGNKVEMFDQLPCYSHFILTRRFPSDLNEANNSVRLHFDSLQDLLERSMSYV